MVTVLLLMGSVGGALIVFLPATMNALDIYLSGVYFVLSLALP